MPSAALPTHILYRLMLSKYFLKEARAKLMHPGDRFARSLAVIDFHDCIDNLLGTVASHLSIDFKKPPSLLDMFNAISSQGALPHRVEVDQLNALRNNAKHKGIPPDAETVVALAPVLERFCEAVCRQHFGKSLLEINLSDAIEDQATKARIGEIENLIDTQDYKGALEAMAYVIFEEFEKRYAVGSGGLFGAAYALALGQKPTPPEEQKDVFPNIGSDDIHSTFLELGIEPDLYYRFHNLVPKVGYDNLRDKELIIDKDYFHWHEKNWTEDNCRFCLDFLINFLVRRQKGFRGYKIITKIGNDKITFIRDSDFYKDAEGKHLEGSAKAGETWTGNVYDYVDGAWAKPGEQLGWIILSNPDTKETRILYVKKADVEVDPDQEVHYLDMDDLVSSGGESEEDESEEER